MHVPLYANVLVFVQFKSVSLDVGWCVGFDGAVVGDKVESKYAEIP